MNTVDLRVQTLNVQELLRLAQSDSLLILADDDHSYTLEKADAFEKEIAMLGQGERFVDFLKERSKEPGSVSLEEVEKRLSSQCQLYRPKRPNPALRCREPVRSDSPVPLYHPSRSFAAPEFSPGKPCLAGP